MTVTVVIAKVGCMITIMGTRGTMESPLPVKLAA